MAKAYKCDLCGRLVEFAKPISGVNFQIGEYKNELTGRYPKMKDVEDICKDCHGQIVGLAEQIYKNTLNS